MDAELFVQMLGRHIRSLEQIYGAEALSALVTWIRGAAHVENLAPIDEVAILASKF